MRREGQRGGEKDKDEESMTGRGEEDENEKKKTGRKGEGRDDIEKKLRTKMRREGP